MSRTTRVVDSNEIHVYANNALITLFIYLYQKDNITFNYKSTQSIQHIYLICCNIVKVHAQGGNASMKDKEKTEVLITMRKHDEKKQE